LRSGPGSEQPAIASSARRSGRHHRHRRLVDEGSDADGKIGYVYHRYVTPGSAKTRPRLPLANARRASGSQPAIPP